jgi:signal transduction histidine kinase
MDDRKKTKTQLFEELQALRQRLAALEMRQGTYPGGEPLPGNGRDLASAGLDITAGEAAEKDLRDARDQWERRVAQRIAELAQANERLRQDIAHRERVEEQLQNQQRLLRRLLDLQEKERKLIAYEIHDGFVQSATAALMNLETSSRLWHQDPTQVQESLQAALRLLGDSLAEARRLIRGLRPPILDESGIVAAVQSLAAESPERGGPQVEFVHHVQFDRLPPQLESIIFRIVQEALTNARRHSRSDRVRLAVLQQDGRIRIEVQDWGVGFDPAKVEEGHFGLEGIRQRARLLGGRADIQSAPGQGTRVTLEIPLLPSLPDSPPVGLPTHLQS